MSARAWMEAARFLWAAGRGYRLRPWRSPYLLWRIETYSGMPADSIGTRAFFRFLWRERRSLANYLRWTGEMRATMRPTPRQPPAGP